MPIESKIKHLEIAVLNESIQIFASRQWCPATSSNFSLRHPDDGRAMLITRSGFHKYHVDEDDFISVDIHTLKRTDSDPRPVKTSAEAALHGWIYDQFPEVNCVLHTHSVYGTLLSQWQDPDKFVFEGLEILKGIAGQTTHQTKVVLPVVENSQDMQQVITDMSKMNKESLPHGYYIRGHGVYAWGESVTEARRHLETFEYLFQYQWEWLKMKAAHS